MRAFQVHFYVTLTILAMLGVVPAPSVGAEMQVPQAPVLRYFEVIFSPSVEGRVVDETTLLAFYRKHLSLRTRAQIAEEQFVGYWQQAARRLDRLGYAMTVEYGLRGFQPGEATDEVLIPVSIKVAYNPSFVHVLAAFVFDLAFVLHCSSLPHCTKPAQYTPEGSSARIVDTFGASREGGVWKLVLPVDVVEEMRKLPGKAMVQHYRVNAAMAAGGMTVRVLDVFRVDDAMIIRLAMDNQGVGEAIVTDALSLASLVSDAGITYDVRILRSHFPDVVPTQTSAAAWLVFEPAPPDSRTLMLSLPGVRIRGQEVFLSAEVVLNPSSLR